MSSQQPSFLEELPSELWVEVIASLVPRDIISLSTVRPCLASMAVILIFLGDMPAPSFHGKPKKCLGLRSPFLLSP